jgi:putative membrane protein
MMHRLSARGPVVALLALVLVASTTSCAKKKEEAQTAAPPETTASQPAPTLTDANIAAIVVAANTMDIQNAELARAMSKAPAVKKFAAQMITDHASVNQKATDLVTKLKVTLEENEASRQLVANANATRDSLKTQNGVEFDRAYVANEVAYHQAVIDLLDTTLIPDAQNAELKALLESVRPAFAAHLEMAKTLQASLAK